MELMQGRGEHSVASRADHTEPSASPHPPGATELVQWPEQQDTLHEESEKRGVGQRRGRWAGPRLAPPGGRLHWGLGPGVG